MSGWILFGVFIAFLYAFCDTSGITL